MYSTYSSQFNFCCWTFTAHKIYVFQTRCSRLPSSSAWWLPPMPCPRSPSKIYNLTTYCILLPHLHVSCPRTSSKKHTLQYCICTHFGLICSLNLLIMSKSFTYATHLIESVIHTLTQSLTYNQSLTYSYTCNNSYIF